MVQTSVPVLHTRSRTNSLVQPPNKLRVAVPAEQPMGCFVAQVPSVSDSLKALSQSHTPPSSPVCDSTPRASSRFSIHKAWWSTIKGTRSRTPSITSVPALSRTHSLEPETEPEIQTPIFRTPSPISNSLLHPESHQHPPLHDTKPLPPLHPHLARPEKKSRLKKSITCSVCLKLGDDFPRCGKCGMAWCSRSCRLKSIGQDPYTGKPLKKHIC